MTTRYFAKLQNTERCQEFAQLSGKQCKRTAKYKVQTFNKSTLLVCGHHVRQYNNPKAA